MIVVDDSTPLIALSRIGQLDLIRELYTNIMIPFAVFQEVVSNSQGRIGETEVNSADWIHIHHVESNFLIDVLRDKLDHGESEAIALAMQLKADLIIADELKARRVISARKIAVIGTIGLLVLAKNKGLIENVLPLIDDLKRNEFHVSDKLYQIIRNLVAE